MNEWKRISSLAHVRRGASPRPIGDPSYFGGNVGWVRISDVTRSSRFLRETEQYVSPLGESLSVRVNPGDLVMSICGTLGRPIVIDIPACIHDGFVQFTNLKNVDSVYLFYALQFSESKFNGMGQPGTQTNLNTTLVGRLEIFAPHRQDKRHHCQGLRPTRRLRCLPRLSRNCGGAGHHPRLHAGHPQGSPRHGRLGGGGRALSLHPGLRPQQPFHRRRRHLGPNRQWSD